MVKAKAEREGLNQRDVCRQTGVAPHITSRVFRGIGHVQTDNLMRLCGWLGVSPDFFSTGAAGLKAKGGTTLERIDIVLQADESLSVEARKQLSNLLRTCYDQLVGDTKMRLVSISKLC